MSWDEMKQFRDREVAAGKGIARGFWWEYGVKPVLEDAAVGLGSAAWSGVSTAAGGLKAAGEGVYDFYKGMYDKFWNVKKGLDSLAVYDDYLRKYG